jgi:hypothetical protein
MWYATFPWASVVCDVSLGVCHASWFSPEDKELLIYVELHSVVNDDFRRFNQKGRQNNRLRFYCEVLTETKAEGESICDGREKSAGDG